MTGRGTLAQDLERAHRDAVRAGVAGLQDPALGAQRLRGPAVPALAEAAVSSATPFLRAPLLARISVALLLHTAPEGNCRSCLVQAPCPTMRALRW
jgi:hypothetical protein